MLVVQYCVIVYVMKILGSSPDYGHMGERIFKQIFFLYHVKEVVSSLALLWKLRGVVRFAARCAVRCGLRCGNGDLELHIYA